jgi:hypothetical protein
VLATVDNPDLAAFWEQNYPRLYRQGAVDPILNKLSRFLDNPLVRDIVSQSNRIDFHQVLREGKVLICNLSKGRLTEEVSILLGSFILSRLQIAALARAHVPPQERRLFVVIVDEFQSYAGQGTDSSSIRVFLSEARKYRVALVVATQFPSQLDREVTQAIFGNVGSLICLRSGALDAQVLQRELGQFGARELLDLEVGQALVRLGSTSSTFNVAIPEVRSPRSSLREEIKQRSRERYCRPRQEVEQSLRRSVNAADLAAQRAPAPPVPGRGSLLVPAAVNAGETGAEVTSSGVQGRSKIPVASGVSRRREPATAVDARIPRARDGLAESAGSPDQELAVQYRGQISDQRTPAREKRGESQHRYLQSLIKRMAEDNGYRATVEQPTPNGLGRVDVSLERGGMRIACEISVASTPEQELANIEKCLRADYDRVILCSADKRTLTKVKALAAQRLQAAEREKVLLHGPEELLLYLQQEGTREVASEERVRGYRVKVQYIPVEEAERKAKREAMSQVIIQAMRRLREEK